MKVNVNFRLWRLLGRKVGLGKMLRICIIKVWSIIKVKIILKGNLRKVVRIWCLWINMSPCNHSHLMHRVIINLDHLRKSGHRVWPLNNLEIHISMGRICLFICPCNSHLTSLQLLSILSSNSFKILFSLRLRWEKKKKGSRYLSNFSMWKRWEKQMPS